MNVWSGLSVHSFSSRHELPTGEVDPPGSGVDGRGNIGLSPAPEPAVEPNPALAMRLPRKINQGKLWFL